MNRSLPVSYCCVFVVMNLVFAGGIFAFTPIPVRSARSKGKSEVASEDSGADVSYVFPVPNSSYLDPASQIISRARDNISPAAVGESGLFKIVGSTSGEHRYSSILSDDKKTIVIQPAVPFSNGEKITVSMSHPIESQKGVDVLVDPFTFTISTSNVNSDNAVIEQIREANDPLSRSFKSTASKSASSDHSWRRVTDDNDLPADFPRLTVTKSDNPTPGYIFLGTILGSNSAGYGN